MMSEPLLHPQTKASLQAVIAQPPQGLLLTGPAGIGKSTVATWLGSQLLAVDSLGNQPYVLELGTEEGKSIGIDAVRELEHFLSLRATGESTINRLVFIHHADSLTTESQNALLKTLEEPPAGTMLLLTADRAESLLPTVRSRLQQLEIMAPSADLIAESLAVDPVRTKRIMTLSGGLPGLAHALAAADTNHPLAQAAQTARELLQQTAFERLANLEALSKNRQQAQAVSSMLALLAHTALASGSNNARWQRILATSHQAEADLQAGATPKLVLTNLFISL